MREQHPAYAGYKHLLSSGWIPGFPQVDNSDAQYRSFRGNFLRLSLFMAAFVGASRIASKIFLKLNDKIRYNFVASLVCLFILHGFNVLFVCAISAANYVLAKKKIHPLLNWLFILAVIVLVEKGNAWVHFVENYFGYFLGFYPRWYVSFNFTVLRIQ